MTRVSNFLYCLPPRSPLPLFNEWSEQLVKQGLEQGLEDERRLLIRLAKRRFGEDCADHLAPLLAAVGDPEMLGKIGEALVDQEDAEAFLAGARALVG